jgi:hypothetical protein
MTQFVYTDAVVTVDGDDLSDWISSATVSVEVDDVENTTFGAGWRSRLGGLKDWSLQLTFHQDFDAAAVDATLWPLLGTSVAVTVKGASGSTSATNPAFSGNVLMNEYSPLDGSVGDLSTTSVTWPGNGPLARGTS